MASLAAPELDARTAAAKRFEEALQGFNRANRQVLILESAQRWRDEAMARLPGLALYVERAPERLARHGVATPTVKVAAAPTTDANRRRTGDIITVTQPISQ